MKCNVSFFHTISHNESSSRRSTDYLLSNLMAIPDRIKVHTVGAQGGCHQVDFRELRLEEQCHGQFPTLRKHSDRNRTGKMTMQSTLDRLNRIQLWDGKFLSQVCSSCHKATGEIVETNWRRTIIEGEGKENAWSKGKVSYLPGTPQSKLQHKEPLTHNYLYDVTCWDS